MTTPAYPLRTARLTLRMPEVGDVGALTAYRNDPQVAAMQDWDLPYPRERAERLVAAHVGRTDVLAGEGTQLAIDLDGQLIGDLYVGLDEPAGIAEIGFSMAVPFQGKGYALEAASAVVDDLVDRVGVHRIIGQSAPANDSSVRLLERLGMSFEAFGERSYWERGAYADNVIFAMSAQQRRAWRDRPRTPPAHVRLVEIAHENFASFGRLRTHHSQERFVATVSDSYADAHFPGSQAGHPVVPVLRGIEADGDPVGFLMWADAVNAGTPEPLLWRFLIDRSHQGRGIGSRALEEWLALQRAAGHSGVRVSWVPGRGGPEAFYPRHGFVPTGERVDGEALARLEL